MTKLNFDLVVRLVDAWKDDDPKTRDSSPGKVFGHNLIKIGSQIERRRWRKDRIKHIIFLEEGTRNIWYKRNFNYPAVVAMGFSLRTLDMHHKSVPMEVYADVFLSPPRQIVDALGMAAGVWARLNDYRVDKHIGV